MIQCILVNWGLKWFGFEITANALVSITRRCSGNECPGFLFMDPSELQKLGKSEKVNLRSFSLYRNYSYPLTLSNKCRWTLLELNSEGPYPSSEKEIKFRRCLFTHSIKHEIRHFHVVVVQKRAKKCTKKAWCTCKVVVFLVKTIVFFDVFVAVRFIGS